MNMIKFEDNKAIYEQMADRLCDEIIAGTYRLMNCSHVKRS